MLIFLNVTNKRVDSEEGVLFESEEEMGHGKGEVFPLDWSGVGSREKGGRVFLVG